MCDWQQPDPGVRVGGCLASCGTPQNSVTAEPALAGCSVWKRAAGSEAQQAAGFYRSQCDVCRQMRVRNPATGPAVGKLPGAGLGSMAQLIEDLPRVQKVQGEAGMAHTSVLALGRWR